MPTCSQAKIITNLESDIHKRLFELTNLNINNNSNSSGGGSSNGDVSPNDLYIDRQSNNQQRIQQDQSSLRSKLYSNNRLNSLKYNQDYTDNNNDSRRNQLFYYPSSNLLDIRKKTIYELVKPTQQQQQHASILSKSRRQSINTESSDIQSTCCEMPPLVPQERKVGFNNNIDRRESVPANFLYNSSLRANNSKYPFGKASLTKGKLNRIERSDGEDDEVGSSDINSEKSNLSLPEIADDKSKLKNNEKTSKNDFTQYVLAHDRSKRNSIDSNDAAMEGSRKFSSYSNHNLSSYFSNFPKLALEVEAIEQYSNSLVNMQQATNNNQNDINVINSDIDLGCLYSDSLSNQKKFSVNQAKRLLALASIRPSKTFHKTMTDEEVLILKKYYEEIKPKPSNGNNYNSQNGMSPFEIEKAKYETYPPIVYDSAKVDFSSLNKLKNFISLHKKEIDEGIYCIDYDMTTEPRGFVLKDVKNNENVIKFPNELNDSFLALAAANSSDKESQLMNEANLFRIVNWNDTIVAGSSNLNDIQFSSNKKLSKKKLSKLNSNSDFNKNNILLSSSSSISSSSNLNRSSSPSSTLSFEYIKNLSNLVSSILEPKLLKQLTYTGVDVSVLPGGKNFDMPSFEELGIDLNGILSNHSNNNNNLNGDQINSNLSSTPKIKLSTIKKMKEKVNASKVMWFSGPPERKPHSVIFEYPSSGINSKIDHETILNQTNIYLKEIGGHVESLELIPRSVQFASVYVEDLWVLTLNHMNTKFYTITNGIKINNETILVKSYDDFIFSEYERFIRNEKFKKIIKNHEKVLASKNNKSNKFNSLSNQHLQQQQ